MNNPFSDELVIEYRVLLSYSNIILLYAGLLTKLAHIFYLREWCMGLVSPVSSCSSVHTQSPISASLPKPSVVCILQNVPVGPPSYRWAPSLLPTLSHDTHTTGCSCGPLRMSLDQILRCACAGLQLQSWTSLPCCLPGWCQHRAQHCLGCSTATSSPTFGLTTL